jgi:hypothetical protein
MWLATWRMSKRMVIPFRYRSVAAQEAEMAANIIRQIEGHEPLPFHYHDPERW